MIDKAAHRAIARVKSDMFQEFSARIWETILPNGVVLRNAVGKDLQHARGWFTELASKLKPTQKVWNHFTTKQLFDLSERYSSKSKVA